MPSAFPVPGDEVRAAATDDDRSTLREEGEVHVCSNSRHAGMLPCVRECASSSHQTMGCLYSHSLTQQDLLMETRSNFTRNVASSSGC